MKSQLIIKKVILQFYIDLPAKNSLEFDNFILNFEKMLSGINSSNLHFSIILGDFNMRSHNWWQGDTQTSEGSQFMFLNKNTRKQVAIFNDILMNIISNYISNKNKNDRDPHG